MLCPQIPLMFMGEEIASRTPFLFFTDHHAGTGRCGARGPPERVCAVSGIRRSGDARADSRSECAANVRGVRAACRYRACGQQRECIVPATDRAAAGGDRCRGSTERARSMRARSVPKAVMARWRMGDGAVLTLASNLDAMPVSINAACKRADCFAHPMMRQQAQAGTTAGLLHLRYLDDGSGRR